MNRLSTPMFVLTVAMLGVGCRHDWRGAEQFASEIRCGMTLQEIQSLAQRHGIQDPVAATYHGYPNKPVTIKPKELDFVEIWFENGGAVALQLGNLVAFTTAVEYGPVRPLCGDYLPPSAKVRQQATSPGG